MNQDFSDVQIADFLRKSYFVVDGLWFVKTEEKHGFDEAMEMDEAVWDVMSKVQARKAKSLLQITGDSLADLTRAFSLKLTAEGYDFEVETNENEVNLTITLCPWYEVLKSADRAHIAENIANRICKREFGGWAKEFSPDISFEIQGRLCVKSDKCEQCRMVFKKG